jgi:4-phytase/acid phosphatase/peptide/nickel transport system substrate-binding protein
VPYREVVGRRLVAVVLGMAVVLASLTSCGTSGDRAASLAASTDGDDAGMPPQRGGHLVSAIETDPNGLDPTRNAFDPVGIQLANALYDPMAAFDAAGTAQPYLARAIEPVEGYGFSAWRIFLRPGVRFQSGRPLDAEAVRTFMDAVRGEYVEPATGQKRSSITQDAARYISGIDVVAPDQVLVRMRRAWATFPALLTGQGGYVVSPGQIDDPEGHSHPDGTGPFRLGSWELGTRFVLARNADYWRVGLPYLDGVDFVVEADGAERIAGLQRGAVDLMSVGYATDVGRLDDIVRDERERGGPARIRLERDPGSSEAISIMLNTARAPLDSDIVRQALAYATDVETLARDNGWSPDRLIDGPFPPASRWYVPTDMPRFDPGKARLLVDEYKRREGVDDVSFELLGAYEPRMLQELAEQWAQVGIHARVTMTDFRRAVPLAVGGLYDALQFRYFSAVDPDILYHFWTSETSRPVGELSLNFSRFATPAIDAALARGRSTDDEAVRREAYATVQREFARYVPYVWLFRTEWVVARRARVHAARNVTLPDGAAALPFDTGTYRLTQTWVSSAS